MAVQPALLSVMEESRRSIPDVIRALIAAQHRTALDVASAIGMSPSSFYARLNGKSEIQAAELAALASYFGVGTDVFYDPPTWLRSR